MKNNKLLQEAIQYIINGEEEAASALVRKFFVAEAQKINKKLNEEFAADEEEMDDEADKEEEADDEVCENFDMNPEDSMTDEIGYAMDEAEEEPEADDEFGADEFDVEPAAEEVPDADEWADIQSAFGELEELFNSLGDDEDVDLDEPEAEADDDQFSDVDFGDDEMKESFKMKDVPAVDKQDHPSDTKSPVASNASSPVAGVKAVKTKKSPEGEDQKFETDQTLDYTVDDQNNQLSSDKEAMKQHAEPKHKATSAKSPIAHAPKQQRK